MLRTASVYANLPAPITVSGSRNFLSSDNNSTLIYSGSSDITLTIPSGLDPTFTCSVIQAASGKVTVVAGSGVTVGNIGLTSGANTFLTVQAVSQDSYGIQNPVSNGQTLLGVSAIPFIVMASGSWTAAANGIITVPTQTTVWPAAYVYMPANSITASNTAGWYYGVFQSTTSVRLYNNTYNTAGGTRPAIPASPTAFSAAAGSNTTQDTMPIQGPTFTIPGGSLGPVGNLQMSVQLQSNNSAQTKAARIGFGASTFSFASLTTSPILGELDVMVQNTGITTRQMVRTKTSSATGSTPTFFAQDTGSNTPVALLLDSGTTANDFIIGHYARMLYTYGA